MAKKKLGSKSNLFPYPVTLVDAMVDGKPNFMTIAFIGIVNMNPAMVAMGANRGHYTCKGIRENMAFSVNIPTEKMMEVTDYCGLNSGDKTDKSGIFEVFYGSLKNAPMIKECPVNLECKVMQVLELGGMDTVFIAQVMESYADEECLTGSNVDIEKLRPMIFSMYENKYLGIGKYMGKGWSAGKGYKKA